MDYYELRAKESMGKMEVHIVSFRAGARRHNQLMPIRIADTQVRDELKLISREIPHGTPAGQLEELFPDIYQRIQALIDTPVEELHVTTWCANILP